MCHILVDQASGLRKSYSKQLEREGNGQNEAGDTENDQRWAVWWEKRMSKQPQTNNKTKRD